MGRGSPGSQQIHEKMIEMLKDWKGSGCKSKIDTRDLRSLKQHCIKSCHIGKGLLWQTFVKHYNMELHSEIPLKTLLCKKEPYFTHVQKQH